MNVTRENACLHLVTGSGREALDACRAHSSTGDVILFLDTGVMHLLDNGEKPLPDGGPDVFYASADLQARGIYEAAVSSGVQLADDAEFVRLLRECSHCLSWQ